MGKKNMVLLLTGCVVPNSTDVLVVTDIEVRKRQYIETIEWYLKHTDYCIVFGENSGTDLSQSINPQFRN